MSSNANDMKLRLEATLLVLRIENKYTWDTECYDPCQNKHQTGAASHAITASLCVRSRSLVTIDHVRMLASVRSERDWDHSPVCPSPCPATLPVELRWTMVTTRDTSTLDTIITHWSCSVPHLTHHYHQQSNLAKKFWNNFLYRSDKNS